MRSRVTRTSPRCPGRTCTLNGEASLGRKAPTPEETRPLRAGQGGGRPRAVRGQPRPETIRARGDPESKRVDREAAQRENWVEASSPHSPVPTETAPASPAWGAPQGGHVARLTRFQVRCSRSGARSARELRAPPPGGHRPRGTACHSQSCIHPIWEACDTPLSRALLSCFSKNVRFGLHKTPDEA